LLLAFGHPVWAAEHLTMRRHIMLRILGILAVVAVLGSAMFASAAGLNVFGGTIQAGADATLFCTESAYVGGWGLETDDNTVRSVRIEGINGACVDNEMFVKVYNGATKIFEGKTVIGGTTASFSFPSPYLAPENITGIKIWVEGPNGQ